MHIFLVSLHVLVSAILIGMVLLQKGKGADIGAAFGGASQTVFGPRGAQSFLARADHGSGDHFHDHVAQPRVLVKPSEFGHGEPEAGADSPGCAARTACSGSGADADKIVSMQL